MDREKLILIGGGGHCKVIISQLRKLARFEIVGVVDNYKPVGSSVLGVRVVGQDTDLESFYKKGISYALITIGSVKDNAKRYQLFKKAGEIGYEFPVIVSPVAVMDESVVIDEGTVVMPGCVINVDVSIGKNCIINTGAIIEHDCKIGNHCHIAPGVHLSGGVEIGDLSFVGIGGTIIQGIKIGKNVTVGAGSVVLADISDNEVAVGRPMRSRRKREK